MTDLSSIPTAELVEELKTRDGVIIPHPELWHDIISKLMWHSVREGTIPPKVIVVQEESE